METPQAAAEISDGWVGAAGGAGVATAAWGVSMDAAAGSYKKLARWLLQRSIWRRRATAQELGQRFDVAVGQIQARWGVRPGLRSVALI